MKIMKLLAALSEKFGTPVSNKIKSEVERIGLLVQLSASSVLSESPPEQSLDDVEMIRKQVLEGYKADMGNRMIAQTYNLTLKQVRAALAHWRRQGVIPTTPGKRKRKS